MASIFSSLKSQITSFTPCFSDNFTPAVHYVKNCTCYARMGLAQLEFSFHHRCWYAVMTFLDVCSCDCPGRDHETHCSPHHTERPPRRWKETVPPHFILVLFDCGVPPWAKSPTWESKVLTQIPYPPCSFLANQSLSFLLSVDLASLMPTAMPLGHTVITLFLEDCKIIPVSLSIFSPAQCETVPTVIVLKCRSAHSHWLFSILW